MVSTAEGQRQDCPAPPGCCPRLLPGPAATRSPPTPFSILPSGALSLNAGRRSRIRAIDSRAIRMPVASCSSRLSPTAAIRSVSGTTTPGTLVSHEQHVPIARRAARCPTGSRYRYALSRSIGIEHGWVMANSAPPRPWRKHSGLRTVDSARRVHAYADHREGGRVDRLPPGPIRHSAAVARPPCRSISVRIRPWRTGSRRFGRLASRTECFARRRHSQASR